MHVHELEATLRRVAVDVTEGDGGSFKSAVAALQQDDEERKHSNFLQRYEIRDPFRGPARGAHLLQRVPALRLQPQITQ